MAPTEVLLTTAKSYLNALSTVSAPSLDSLTTPNFHITLAPATTGLSPPFDPTNPLGGISVTRASLLQRFESQTAIISSMNVVIKYIFPVNEAANQVIVWTSASADFREEVTRGEGKEEWRFEPETLFLFTMSEDGEKVEHLFEFQDSVTLTSMGGVWGRAVERLGGGNKGKEE